MADKKFNANTLSVFLELWCDISDEEYEIACKESDNLRYIEEDEEQCNRWEDAVTVIFEDKRDGKFYQTVYYRGRTESQENTFFDDVKDSENMVNCKEVRREEVVTYKYVVV